MQVCTSLQTDNYASTPPLSFYTGRMPFHPPNQQHQSTEGKITEGFDKIAKLASVETDVFARHYALIVVHATVGVMCKQSTVCAKV